MEIFRYDIRRFFLFGIRFFFGSWLLYAGLAKWIFLGPGAFVGCIKKPDVIANWQFLVLVLLCAALTDPDPAAPSASERAS